MLFILPCIFLSTGCGGSNNNGDGTSDLICTVIFYTGISEEFNVPIQEIPEGQKVVKPKNFPNRYLDETTRKNYQFVGWYSDPSRTSEYLWTFTEPVRSNMTLYALWEEI